MLLTLFPFFIATALHLFFTLTTTFFITPEISLYPYLLKQGLTPYTQLIDQHFPTILFGPFNLSWLSATTPKSALAIFIVIIILTDLSAWLYLKKQLKRKSAILIFSAFIICQLLLSSSTLWLESFILLFLSWGLYLSSFSSLPSRLASGFLFGLALSIRPTLLPFFLIYLLFQSKKSSPAGAQTPLSLPSTQLGVAAGAQTPLSGEDYSTGDPSTISNPPSLPSSSFHLSLPLLLSLIASAIPPLIQLLWLTTNQLSQPFWQMIYFNSNQYLSLAGQLPNKNQLIIAGLAFLAPLIVAKKARPLALLFLLTLSLGAYPRFELIHLLPASLTLLLLVRSRFNHFLLSLYLLFSLSLIIYRHPFQSRNFFYPSSLQQTAQKLKEALDNKHFYLLGGPDQLYQLTDSIPTGNYYLPSLPWYHANPTFTSTQITALENNPQNPVIINTQSSLDQQKTTDYAFSVTRYIKQNYQKTHSIDRFHIYRRQDKVN